MFILHLSFHTLMKIKYINHYFIADRFNWCNRRISVIVSWYISCNDVWSFWVHRRHNPRTFWLLFDEKNSSADKYVKSIFIIIFEFLFPIVKSESIDIYQRKYIFIYLKLVFRSLKISNSFIKPIYHSITLCLNSFVTVHKTFLQQLNHILLSVTKNF